MSFEVGAWLAAAPGPWIEHAACRGKTAVMVLPTAAITHRARGAGTRSAHHIDAAKALCADCAVLAECRTWSLTLPDPAFGMVAGGMTPIERNDVRRQRGVA